MVKLQDLRGRYTELHEAEQFGVIVSVVCPVNVCVH